MAAIIEVRTVSGKRAELIALVEEFAFCKDGRAKIFEASDDDELFHIKFEREKAEVIRSVAKTLEQFTGLTVKVDVDGVRRWIPLGPNAIASLKDSGKAGLRAFVASFIGIPVAQLSAGATISTQQLTSGNLVNAAIVGAIAFVIWIAT